jgi:hypothetical protein
MNRSRLPATLLPSHPRGDGPERMSGRNTICRNTPSHIMLPTRSQPGPSAEVSQVAAAVCSGPTADVATRASADIPQCPNALTHPQQPTSAQHRTSTPLDSRAGRSKQQHGPSTAARVARVNAGLRRSPSNAARRRGPGRALASGRLRWRPPANSATTPPFENRACGTRDSQLDWTEATPTARRNAIRRGSLER